MEHQLFFFHMLSSFVRKMSSGDEGLGGHGRGVSSQPGDQDATKMVVVICEGNMLYSFIFIYDYLYLYIC